MPNLNSNVDEIINQFNDEQKELKLKFDYGFPSVIRNTLESNQDNEIKKTYESNNNKKISENNEYKENNNELKNSQIINKNNESRISKSRNIIESKK